MGTKIRIWLWTAASFVLVAGASLADAPRLLSYQGVLTRTDGTVLPNGSYDLTFQIFQDPTSVDSADLLFEQTLSVAVEAGLYNVILSNNDLGSGDLQAVFAGANRYMQVTIGANPAAGVPNPVSLFPRQQIGSVPFALVANQAHDLLAPVGLPANAIILWDQSDVCPDGFDEAAEFRGLTIRGADLSGANDDIPDSAGELCPGGVGCNTDPARYDDQMQLEELVSHDHPTDGEIGPLFDKFPGGGPGTFLGQGVPGFVGTDTLVGGLLSNGGAHGGLRESRGVTPQGGDKAFYQPLRTVLFCRKL